MPRVNDRIVGPILLTNAAATLYTVPAATKIIIRGIHVVNQTGTAATLTFSIGADAAGTRVVSAITIPGNTDITKGIWDYFFPLPMVAAEIFQAYSGTTNVLNMTIEADVYTPG